MAVQERAFRGVDIVRFLKHVLLCLEGKVLIIWDGAPIHRDKAVKLFLAQAGGGAGRLYLEELPGYAPDLNPVEGVWNYLKYVVRPLTWTQRIINAV